jgi:phage replication-related protein YjqB (UPF0714/DUF867 family)
VAGHGLVHEVRKSTPPVLVTDRPAGELMILAGEGGWLPRDPSETVTAFVTVR